MAETYDATVVVTTAVLALLVAATLVLLPDVEFVELLLWAIAWPSTTIDTELHWLHPIKGQFIQLIVSYFANNTITNIKFYLLV